MNEHIDGGESLPLLIDSAKANDFVCAADFFAAVNALALLEIGSEVVAWDSSLPYNCIIVMTI